MTNSSQIETTGNTLNNRVYAKSSAYIDDYVSLLPTKAFYVGTSPEVFLEATSEFCEVGGLRSTQISTLTIFWFDHLKRRNFNDQPSNNMEHHRTPQENLFRCGFC